MNTVHNKKNIRVAIAGLGAIGKSLSKHLAAGSVPGVELTAVSAKNHANAQEFVKTLAHPVKVLKIEELEPEADLVVECAPAEFLGDIIAPFLKKQKRAAQKATTHCRRAQNTTTNTHMHHTSNGI